MKKFILAFVALLALAFAACSSPAFARKSARHQIMAAGAQGVQTSWMPTEAQIEALEKSMGRMFYSVDARISGLPDGVPPYPLSEYYIRYMGTGPIDNRYIIGEAMHESLPEAQNFLVDNNATMPERGGPRYFSVMYDMQSDRITAIRFGQK